MHGRQVKMDRRQVAMHCAGQPITIHVMKTGRPWAVKWTVQFFPRRSVAPDSADRRFYWGRTPGEPLVIPVRPVSSITRPKPDLDSIRIQTYTYIGFDNLGVKSRTFDTAPRRALRRRPCSARGTLLASSQNGDRHRPNVRKTRWILGPWAGASPHFETMAFSSDRRFPSSHRAFS
jgi:hypothetical protein